MSEQNITKLQHAFYEIGADLLAKPTALAQIIEAAGCTVLVFCNTPSDTDLVEVLLKKRGVPARKLIGNVPAPKLEKTLTQLREGELTTLVVTDIAARGIDIDDFDMIINYATPSDGDTYIQRLTKSGEFTRLKKVATLVGPLDITNFHYIKKAVETEFVSEQLPDQSQLQGAKVNRIAAQAAAKNIAEDAKFGPLAEAVLAHPQKAAIIALLLQNTFEVIPSLQVAAEQEEVHEDDDDNRGNRADRSGGRGDRGGDRGDRGDRRGRGRGGRDNDERRGNQGRRPYADLDDEANLQAEEAQQRRSRPNLPPLKEARIYVGQGVKDGISENSLRSLVQERSGITGEDIKRVVIRHGYSFFDVLEEQSAAVLDKLADLASKSGDKLCVKKATVISTQRKAPEESADNAESAPAESVNEDVSQHVDVA